MNFARDTPTRWAEGPGAGAAAGAITGAVVGGTAATAGTGAAVGGATAAAITSSSAGAAGVTAGLAAGPVGWLILGTEVKTGGATFDCWKPILHDTSIEPSEGRLVRDVIQDPRIKEVIVANDENSSDLPKITLVNAWGEAFVLSYLVLPSNNQLVAHAELVAQ